MITAHPMVKGSFAAPKNPQQQFNGAKAASETVVTERDCILGSQSLAIALRRSFINRGIGDRQHNFDCIAIHKENIASLPRRRSA